MAMDTALQLTDPFDTSNESIQQDSIAGVSFTDPFAWVGAITGNIIQDSVALIIRILFFGIAAFIFLKIISNFIDYGAIAETVGNVGKLAAFL